MRKLWLWPFLSLVLLVGACTACGGRLLLGAHPYAIGVRGDCSADGCTAGVEVGGWLVGVTVFPDIGPIEDE